jgi:hypothetical protein
MTVRKRSGPSRDLTKLGHPKVGHYGEEGDITGEFDS